MRTIKVQLTHNNNAVKVTDWNFKTYTLVLTDSETMIRQCKEMDGTFYFETINDFIIKMYGQSKIYPEFNRESVFINYEIETYNTKGERI